MQRGKTQAAKHRLPRLLQLLEELDPAARPALVRADNAFGNEEVMAGLEALGQRYLFKRRPTAGVKRLLERQWSRGEWPGVGQGCDAVAAALKLSGWICAQRVMVRRRIDCSSSNTAPAHDTMTARLPSRAPDKPPLTGAST